MEIYNYGMLVLVASDVSSEREQEKEESCHLQMVSMAASVHDVIFFCTGNVIMHSDMMTENFMLIAVECTCAKQLK